MPTFTDLYYQGPTNLGNIDLKPEKTASFELGIKLNSDLIQAYLVGFYRNGTDIIDWVKKYESDKSEKWQTQNLTQLNSFGTELQMQFNLKKFYGHNLPDNINVNYFYNNLNKKEGQNFISYYVLDNLKHKLVGTINQTVFRKININLKVLFQDRAGSYTQYENNNLGIDKEYEPFWIFDGKINYTLGNLRFYVSVNNIFNQNYVDIGNVIQPGRWAKIGISYELDFD
jgi:iron complex outermembrane receptor protein